jgi:glucose-1-phosphate cytidylyltransferase
LGTRISEETTVRPKPMVEIGGRPILWHIMKIYSAHGINDFVICLGYKGYLLKEFFANYFLHTSDVTMDLAQNRMTVHQNHAEPWRVTLVDTGETTQTGGRLRRVKNYLESDHFCFTYGDGLADIDLTGLIAFHRRQGTIATVTAIQPPGRWGALEIQEDKVSSFNEKPLGDGGWVSGGFFVLSPKVFDYLEGDETVWEGEPLQRLSRAGELSVHLHPGFWHPMDTLRDKNYLEELWSGGKAPWKIW